MDTQLNSVKFIDLVDLDELHQLMASFNAVIGIANAVIDVDGVVITSSGWQEACVEFHRVNTATCKRCIESDTSLVESLTKGEQFAIYNCLNGLVDTAAPIVVDGHHLANIFTGQFFTAPPDMDFFRNQAREFGFDEEKYLAAIRKVPIIEKSRVESVTQLYANIARMLASHGLFRLRQIETERQLEQINRELAQRVDERTTELSEKNQLLLAVLDAIPSLVFWKDADLRYLGCNQQMAHVAGLNSPEEIVGLHDRDLPWGAYAEEYEADDKTVVGSGQARLHYEEAVRNQDGSVSYSSISKVPLRDPQGKVIGLLGAYDDITARKLAEFREQLRGHALGLMAANASLTEILTAIVLGVERGSPGWLCSILLLDESGRHLRLGAAPSLPDFYNHAIDGIEIGLGVGSCGTAAYTGQRVVVENIDTHPYWANYRELTARAGLHACWTEPILGTNGKPVGTFGTYKNAPGKPSASDIELIEQAAHLARIAINRAVAEEALRQKTEALQRSNADLEQFAYSVSHDMRQPLRAVWGHLQLLEGTLQDKLDEDDQQNLHYALDGAKRMDAMIVSLLDYSRVGRKTEAKTWLESRESLDEALSFLTPAIKEAQAQVAVSGTWPRVFASRDELTRLFQNLVGNAVHYHDQNTPPQVEVASQQVGETWRVSVRDHGIGIDPKQIGRLFQFFSRLQSRTKFDGTGMGLALCRRIVEHHQGRIWAESPGEGKGSTFVFELPVSAEVGSDAKP